MQIRLFYDNFILVLHKSVGMVNEILIALTVVILVFGIQFIGSAIITIFSLIMFFKTNDRFLISRADNSVQKTFENLNYFIISLVIVAIFDYADWSGFDLPQIAKLIIFGIMVLGYLLTIIAKFYVEKVKEKIM